MTTNINNCAADEELARQMQYNGFNPGQYPAIPIVLGQPVTAGANAFVVRGQPVDFPRIVSVQLTEEVASIMR